MSIKDKIGLLQPEWQQQFCQVEFYRQGMRSENLEGETGTHMVVSDWRHMRRLQACLKQTQLEVHTKMHQKTIHQSLISDAAIMTMGTNIASGVEFYVVKSTR